MIVATQILLTMILVVGLLYFSLKPMDDDAPLKVVLGYPFAILVLLTIPYGFIMGLIWIWRW